MSRRSHSRTRRRNRGRLGPLFKLLCLIALVVALTAGATVFFRVETVAVSGNSRYTEEEIVAASGIQLNENLYGWNKFKVEQRLYQTLPYIGDVLIRRSLPSTVVITVTEWDAVAQIAPPTPAQAAVAREELEGELPEEDNEAEESESSAQTDGSQADASQSDASQAEPPVSAVAQEPWLISVEGRLLELAPSGSQAMTVTGLTALMPQAGTQLAVPLAEQAKLEALLQLLAAMDEEGMMGDFSSVELGDTQVKLRYLDRFDVLILLNADFHYALRVVSTVREQIEREHGPDAAGTMDLTQENYELGYSPQ